MSHAVTWEYLDAEQVHRCSVAEDKAALVAALKEASAANKSKLFVVEESSELQPEQVAVLADLYTHVIRFANGASFSPEKISTLVGIVAQTHAASMTQRLTNIQAYKGFENRVVAHSVHRPPFSVQIFNMHDVKLLTDYMLTTYFRHYKLYTYAFTAMETAEVRSVSYAITHHVPPAALPPMALAIPLAQWEATQEELRRAEEERLRHLAEEEEAANAEAQRLAMEADRPNMTAGLKQQLDYIKSTVSKMSREKLDELEAKLAALESRVAEVNKPLSSAGPRAPVKPPSKK